MDLGVRALAWAATPAGAGAFFADRFFRLSRFETAIDFDFDFVFEAARVVVARAEVFFVMRRSLARRELRVTAALFTTVLVQPTQQLAHAARRERDAGVCRAVVEVDGVTVGAECVTARKRDIAHVPFALVRSLGAEDP